uniref:DDE Tnp4 domain-containing protein n=1 Tax=Panagrellus redivivus TaxID=6233 RepID=A0A7E4VKD4_PANRE
MGQFNQSFFKTIRIGIDGFNFVAIISHLKNEDIHDNSHAGYQAVNTLYIATRAPLTCTVQHLLMDAGGRPTHQLCTDVSNLNMNVSFYATATVVTRMGSEPMTQPAPQVMERGATKQLIRQLQRLCAVQGARLGELTASRAIVIRALHVIRREALEVVRQA